MGNFIKKLLIIILILSFTNICYAKLPTQTQLDKYFIQLLMTVDNEEHNFLFWHISKFDETGMTLKIGRQTFFHSADKIINLQEALDKYNHIKNQNYNLQELMRRGEL